MLEVVWASCFGEEKELLLRSVEDAKDDGVAVAYLSALEEEMRGEVIKLINQAQAAADGCLPDSTP